MTTNPTENVDPNYRLTDAEALDDLALMLRSPEWHVSMLEDIAEIVTRTGRDLETPAEQWPRH